MYNTIVGQGVMLRLTLTLWALDSSWCFITPMCIFRKRKIYTLIFSRAGPPKWIQVNLYKCRLDPYLNQIKRLEVEETNNKNMWSPGLKIEQFFIIPKKKSEFPLSFFKKNFKDSTSHLDSFFIRYTFFVETLTTIIIRSCNSRSKPARQRLSSLFFLIFGWDKK